MMAVYNTADTLRLIDETKRYSGCSSQRNQDDEQQCDAALVVCIHIAETSSLSDQYLGTLRQLFRLRSASIDGSIFLTRAAYISVYLSHPIVSAMDVD